jgi:uncharacterized protein (TIGR03089 family)
MVGRGGSLPDALRAALRKNPGRPLVTFYDDATGERVELSVQTFDNWVCKLANLFTVELGLGPGEVVRVDFPTHWQSCVTLLGAWVSGLVVSVDDKTSAALTLVGPAGLELPPPDAGIVLASSLRPLGGRFAVPLPAGWLDFAVDVPPQPDVLLADVAVDGDAPALIVEPTTLTHHELTVQASGVASRLGLAPGARLATDVNPATPSGLVITLAAPFVSGSSVVLLANTSTRRRRLIADQERVTCEVWADRS